MLIPDEIEDISEEEKKLLMELYPWAFDKRWINFDENVLEKIGLGPLPNFTDEEVWTWDERDDDIPTKEELEAERNRNKNIPKLNLSDILSDDELEDNNNSELYS